MMRHKPPDQSWESVVEEQKSPAYEAGEFDQLPGCGKPIPELDGPDEQLW